MVTLHLGKIADVIEFYQSDSS